MPVKDYEDLKLYLERNGYFDICVIGNEVCAKFDFMTTRGICVGLDDTAIKRRYCFQDKAEADRAFAEYRELNDDDAHPGGNWIKLKGRYRGQVVDDLNPNWSRS